MSKFLFALILVMSSASFAKDGCGTLIPRIWSLQIDHKMIRDGMMSAFKVFRLGGWSYQGFFFERPMNERDVQDIEHLAGWEKYNADADKKKDTYPGFEILVDKMPTTGLPMIVSTDRSLAFPFTSQGFVYNSTVIPYKSILAVRMLGESKAEILWKRFKHNN